MHKVIFFFFLYSHGLFATEEKPPNVVDKVHTNISQSIIRVSNRIDRFFGSKRAEDQANGTQVKLSYITIKQEGSDLDHEGIIKFRLKLPYLEELLKVSFKKDAPKEEEKKDDGKTEELTAKKVANAIINEPKKWSFHVQTGVKVEIPPQFFANLRLRRSAYLGKWEFRASQEFFWYSRDGFGETTTIDFDRAIHSQLLFRVRNTATWLDETDEFETSHGPFLFWQLDVKKAFSFSLLAQGESRPTFMINNYQGNISYRQLLYKKWFYVETGPTIDFPRTRNWDGILSYSLKLEAILGSY